MRKCVGSDHLVECKINVNHCCHGICTARDISFRVRCPVFERHVLVLRRESSISANVVNEYAAECQICYSEVS